MQFKAKLAGSLLALALLAQVPSVTAADAAGTLKTVKGSVTIERGTQRIPGATGTPVQQADRVVTGPDGSVGILFSDDTLISLGPSSRFSVDAYPAPTANARVPGAFQVSLAKGRMGIVSGKIAHGSLDAMKVRTPDTILGVRGTQFIVEAR